MSQPPQGPEAGGTSGGKGRGDKCTGVAAEPSTPTCAGGPTVAPTQPSGAAGRKAASKEVPRSPRLQPRCCRTLLNAWTRRRATLASARRACCLRSAADFFLRGRSLPDCMTSGLRQTLIRPARSDHSPPTGPNLDDDDVYDDGDTGLHLSQKPQRHHFIRLLTATQMEQPSTWQLCLWCLF